MSYERAWLSLAGQRYGRWTVIEPAPMIDRWRRWVCRCDCGNEKQIAQGNLRNGSSQSCGCLARERIRESRVTHGQTKGRTYSSWASMKSRCKVVNHPDFALYGARGIKVCERWQLFENFLADMGERPPGTSIDRINNNGGYEPGNCRWATAREQSKNRRRARSPKLEEHEYAQIAWLKEEGYSYRVIGEFFGVKLSHAACVVRRVRLGRQA